MGIRDTLRRNAQPLLHPGEVIQAVFWAQATSPYTLMLIQHWNFIVANASRIVVVTNERIIVCQGGRVRAANTKGVLRELPRPTVIGPPSGVFYKTNALGETMWINRRFRKDVRTADSS